MKKIRALMCILLFFVLISSAYATLTIEIDVKPSFNLNEKTFFDYNITSNEVQTIIYTPYIVCPDAPAGFLEQKTIDLEANIAYTNTYFDITIDESIEPQTCTAIIEIISSAEQAESQGFSILTNPSFAFSLNFCKSLVCTEKTKVFVKGKDIFLDYSSEVSEPVITATLTYPDKTIQELNLPISIKAEQIGTHELEITASKEGYKTINLVESFAVIESAPVIENASVCNADGICSGEEHAQNCPQDCVSGGADSFCDGVSDGKCDLDCGIESDVDCLKNKLAEDQLTGSQLEEEPGTGFDVLTVIAWLMVLLIILVLVYLFVVKRKIGKNCKT